MKALGIVALSLIFSVLGCLAPLFAGFFISALSGILAIWACKKHIPYAFVSLVLNAINLLVFSPQKLSSSTGGIMGMEMSLLIFVLCFILPTLLIQIIGFIMYTKNVRMNNQIKT